MGIISTDKQTDIWSSVPCHHDYPWWMRETHKVDRSVCMWCLRIPTSPTAWRRNDPAQVALASSTLSPISSNASRMEPSSPGLHLSMNTLIRKPFSRTSTLTNGWRTLACCADAISWFSFAIFCFRSLMYDDASAIMDMLSPCMQHALHNFSFQVKVEMMWKKNEG